MKLQYEIAVTGENQLRRAVRGVESELKASSRRVSSQSRRTTGGAGNVLTGGGDHQYWRRAMRESARYREQEERRVARVTERERQQAASRQAASTKAEQRQQDQNFRRKIAMQNRYFAQEQRERERLDRKEESRARRAQSIRVRAAESMAGGVGNSVRNVVGGVARVGATALGVAGGFAAAQALREQVDVRGRAARLANQAGDPSIKGTLAQEAQGVRGFTAAESLTAVEGFVTKTGDLAAGRGMLQGMGKLALATGTDFGELGEAAGQAFNVIRDTVKDPQEQLAMLGRVMNTLAGQGNLGAVEIRDMATELGTLGAATRKFEGGPEGLLKTVGAMSQAAVARGGAASAAEASTAVTRFAGDLVKHTDDFQKVSGTSAFVKGSGKTKLRDPRELIVDLLKGTGGDLTKIKEVYGEYGERAVGGFSPLYTEAERRNAALPAAQRLAKGEAGARAVNEEFNRFTNAGISDRVIAERAASVLEEPEMQFKEASKAFNLAVGTQLLPVMTQLVPQFASLLPEVGGAARIFAKLISGFAAHPVTGIGLLIGAAIVKDIYAAKLGSAIKGALAGGIARLGGGGAGGETGGGIVAPVGGGGGKGGKFFGKPTGAAMGAAAGLGAMIGLTVATAIITAGVANFEAGEESMKSSGANLNRARTMTDPEELRRIRNEEQTKLAKRRERGFFGWAIAGIAGDGAADAITDPNRSVELKTQENNVAEIEKRLVAAESFQQAAVAIEKSTASQEEAAKKLSAAADRLGLVNAASRSQPIISKDRT